MAAVDKAFRAEYSKSDRATCRHCTVFIAKDTLRYAQLVRSHHFDGVEPHWYHSGCWFKKFKGSVLDLDDVEGAPDLRWEDQQRLQKFIDQAAGGCNGAGTTKEAKAAAKAAGAGEFEISYAASSRSVCKGCLKFILKGDVRVSKMVTYSSDGDKFSGSKVPAWHHVKCFAQRAWFALDPALLPGWSSISKEHQHQVAALIEKVRAESAVKRKGGVDDSDGDAAGKRIKVDDFFTAKEGGAQADDRSGERDDAEDGMDEDTREALQQQSEALWMLSDGLQKHASTRLLREMLEANGQQHCDSLTQHDLRAHVADMLLFGALDKCPVCAQFAVRQGSGTYACHGRLSAWSRCTYTSRTAARLSGAVQLPAEARTELPASCKPAAPHQRGERVLPPPATTGKAAAATDEADAPPPFLSGVTLMLVGKLEGGRGAWAKKIEAAGGTVGTTVDASVVCVVTSQAELSRELESGRLYKARRMLIPVVSEAFLTASFAANKLASIPAHTLRGYEPSAGRGDGRRTNAASATVKLTGKAEVHEASGLVGRARVVTDGGLVYHATMTLADAAAGLNSFYILQALQTHGSAGEEGCWLFRAWGRVGDTRIGGNKLEQMPLAEATEQFEELFYEKSGNNFRRWAGGKEELVKRPGKFFPLEQDFGADKVAAAKAKAEAAKAKGGHDDASDEEGAEALAEPTEELLKILFDVQTYRAALLEYDIDPNLMPLGKLSRRHVEQGLALLTEVQASLDDATLSPERRAAALADASNRFNTLVPHSQPLLIDSKLALARKVKMVEALRDMEVAAALLAPTAAPSSLRGLYKQLNCGVQPVDDGATLQMLRDLLAHGQGPTHREWTLRLDAAFAVQRAGEATRFQPFTQLPNHQLLFHGSRLANFIGILTHGVRIAPKEAPATGYMFGKGAYFADVASKSAQYCCPSRAQPRGLLALCAVALGRTHDVTTAQFMLHPPRGRHSTRALGLHRPDPAGERMLEDGRTKVQCGRPLVNEDVEAKGTDLQYNEYVVYDTSQVLMKYLLQVSFEYVSR